MSSSLLPSLLAFIAVLAMIPIALWLMKRAQGLRPGATGPLSLVAGLSLGPRERIVVVHAAGRYLVVGITGQSMSLLSTLDSWPGQTGGAAQSGGTQSDTTSGTTSSPASGQGFAGLLRGLQSRSRDPNQG